MKSLEEREDKQQIIDKGNNNLALNLGIDFGLSLKIGDKRRTYEHEKTVQ